MDGWQLKKLLIIDTSNVSSELCKSVISPYFIRPMYSLFNELNINPKQPIRSQKPDPLPDRKALDDVAFDTLGLTPAERDEVYWAVCELVKNRLEKAKSV